MIPQSRNMSVWADTAPAYEPSPPLRGELRVDVAVVGAGYTGLSTALHLRVQGEPVTVAVVEAGAVGDSAAGRNAGAVVDGCGIDSELVATFYGRTRADEASAYGVRAQELTRTLIHDHALDSDIMETGSVMIAMDEAYLPALRDAEERARKNGGHRHDEWWDADRLAQEFASPLLAGAGAAYEPRTFMINPCKHVRELKRLAVDAGAQVFEHSPVTDVIRSGGKVRVVTPRGVLIADRVVFATNAYTHLLPSGTVSRNDQWPVYSHQIATEPLTDAQWERLGVRTQPWTENNISVFQWFRTTVDRRIVFGGRYMGAADRHLTREYDARTFRRIENDLRAFFPQLADVKVSHRWGGPISAVFDLIPHVGFIDRERQMVRVSGCWGHGVALGHLHGQTVADLVRDVDSELARTWFVQRTPWTLPPAGTGPLGLGLAMALMQRDDTRRMRNAAGTTTHPERRRALERMVRRVP